MNYKIEFSWDCETKWSVSNYNDTLATDQRSSFAAVYIHLVQSFEQRRAESNYRFPSNDYPYYRIVSSDPEIKSITVSPATLERDFSILCKKASSIAHEIKT